MGSQFADQYSYLHFAVGVLAYFWNIHWLLWFIVHTLFELIENTSYGIQLINQFYFWPGGKTNADSALNMVGDSFFAMAGWGSAYLIDHLGKQQGWYKNTHIQ